MNSVVNFVLKNKLAVWILTVLLLAGGLYSGSKMKLESMPDIEIPYLIVTTAYPMATPNQVDTDVAQPLSKALESVKGLNNVSSMSYENYGLTTLEFEYGTDMSTARKNVETALGTVKLAEAIQTPEIIELNLNSVPILTASISAKDMSKEELTELIEKTLVTDIKDIKGASNVAINGTVFEEVTIDFNNEMLEKYELTVESLTQLIQANKNSTSLGLVEFKDSKESIYVTNAISSLEELKSMSLPFKDSKGKQLTLSNFAELKLVADSNTISRTDGNESISISITKGQEANTVEIANLTKELIAEFEKDNKGVEVIYTLDQATPIEDSVHTMLSKALVGASVAIAIILIFLRDIKSTLISLVSIPLSLLSSLIVLHYMGITLNVMTLGAMTVAIGRVIDDSIVVVENIYRRLYDKDEKLSGRALIREATLQMFVPITSSTAVTIAVFLPIIFVGGMIGEIFMPFALAMGLSLIASLIVAVTVVPVMAHSLFKKAVYTTDKSTLVNKHHQDNSKSKLTIFYVKSLEWVLNHKIITIVASILLVGGSIGLATQLKFGFMPTESESAITIQFSETNGTLEEDIIKSLTLSEEYLLESDDIQNIQLSYGGDSSGLIGLASSGSGSITYQFNSGINTDKYKDKQNEILEKLNSLDIQGTWDSSASGMSMGGSSDSIQYTVTGESLDEIESTVNSLVDILDKNKEVEDVTSGFSESFIENRIVVDTDKASQYGVTTAQVMMTLMNYAKDNTITNVTKENGKVLNVTQKGVKTSYNDFEELLEKPVAQFGNIVVKVKDIVDVQESSTISSLTRNNGTISVAVSGKLIGDDVNAVSSSIKKEIEKLDLPLGIEIVTGGVTAQMVDAFAQLGLAMLAAICLVYFILVLTFREGLAPFSILFSLPMTVIGVVVALFITGVQLDISGMLGLLMLIGIVVTNAIVLIDRVIENEYNGKDMRTSIVEAGTTRLRPILMTAIATVGALLPLALGLESGGLISKGLGITVIGGLISSTILTLYIVPVVYEALSKLLRKDRKNINWD